jgi:hypothetical protein
MAEVEFGGERRAPEGSAIPATSVGVKDLAKLERQARLHERGEPCGRGDCGIAVCRELRLEIVRTRATNKAKERAYWHSFGKPCGQGDCPVEICRKARQATKSKAKPKPDPVRTNPGRPLTMTAEERRRREAHSKSLPCGVPGCAEPSCRVPLLTNTKEPAATPVPKRGRPERPQPSPKTAAKTVPMAKKSPRGTMICRECLRTKSLSAFPNPRVRRCEACGGQESSSSVRTVSGGAPGLGRRRR